eukprot:2177251-Pleurochrysis_carterae.AAC.1
MRRVCRDVFLSTYPISLATLKRIVALKRANGRIEYEDASKRNAQRGEELGSTKSLEAIAWWTSYAEAADERDAAGCGPHAYTSSLPTGYLR